MDLDTIMQIEGARRDALDRETGRLRAELASIEATLGAQQVKWLGSEDVGLKRSLLRSTALAQHVKNLRNIETETVCAYLKAKLAEKEGNEDIDHSPQGRDVRGK